MFCCSASRAGSRLSLLPGWPPIEPCPACHRPTPLRRRHLRHRQCRVSTARGEGAGGFRFSWCCDEARDGGEAGEQCEHEASHDDQGAARDGRHRRVGGRGVSRPGRPGDRGLSRRRPTVRSDSVRRFRFPRLYAALAPTRALRLGWRQSGWEGMRGTYLFLLHRPASRAAMVGTKIAIGLALLLLLTAWPILIYALWASTPGRHASPFAWSMTLPAWAAGRCCRWSIWERF